MEFSKEELYEIEKLFDCQVSHLIDFYANYIFKTKSDTHDEVFKKMNSKIVEDSAHTHDLFRTISAKARIMREKIK